MYEKKDAHASFNQSLTLFKTIVRQPLGNSGKKLHLLKPCCRGHSPWRKISKMRCILKPCCRGHSPWRNSGKKLRFLKSLNYSHSIVAGGLEETSYTTRETSLISFMIRVEILSTNSYGRWAKRAVIKSTVSTARSAMTHA